MFEALQKKANYIMLGSIGMLIVAGLAILASASSHMAARNFGDAYYFLKHQVVNGFLVGVVGFLVGYFIPLKFLKKAAFPILLVNLAMLVAVFTPLGANFGTSSRWLEIAGIPIQPSEFLKITFIMYVSAWLTAKGKDRKSDAFEGLIPFMIICAIIGGLLIAQPSTSILAIILTAAFVIYFVGGMKLTHIFVMGTLAIAAIGVVIFTSPYRKDRIITFFNPTEDVKGKSYHINQALTTIGSGGVVGVGYGKSTLKESALPEPIGDSIFAIIAEEFGFIGSAFFIILYFLIVISGFLGSLRVRNEFGKLMLIGFSSLIGIQAFIHIGAISGVIPLTGVPLPFISYGGTALATFMAMSGLMANIIKNG